MEIVAERKNPIDVVVLVQSCFTGNVKAFYPDVKTYQAGCHKVVSMLGKQGLYPNEHYRFV